MLKLKKKTTLELGTISIKNKEEIYHFQAKRTQLD